MKDQRYFSALYSGHAAHGLRHHFWGNPKPVNWPDMLADLHARGLGEIQDLDLDQDQDQDQDQGLAVLREVSAVPQAKPNAVVMLSQSKWLKQLMGQVAAGGELPGLIVLDHKMLAQVKPWLAAMDNAANQPIPQILVSAFPMVALGLIKAAMYPKAVIGWDAADYDGQLGRAPDAWPNAQVSPSALVSPSAHLEAGVRICAGAVVGRDAEIGQGSVIGPGASIGAGVVLGAGCEVGAGARLLATVAGNDCKFRANAVVGERGYGLCIGPDAILASASATQRRAEQLGLHTNAPADGHISVYEVPQISGVRFGHRCEVRHGAVVDRGALTDTWFGDDVHVDSQSVVGHGARFGDRVSLGAFGAIGGQAHIGDNCVIWARSAVQEGRTLGPNSDVKYGSIVTKDFAAGNVVLKGDPAVEAHIWHRREGFLTRLFKRK